MSERTYTLLNRHERRHARLAHLVQHVHLISKLQDRGKLLHWADRATIQETQ